MSLFCLEVIADQTGVPICEILNLLLKVSNRSRATSDDLCETVYYAVLWGEKYPDAVFKMEKLFNLGYVKEMIAEKLKREHVRNGP